jgi:serine/threonine protein kinase
VPHAKLISHPVDAEAYLAEARTVANLDHPGIVPVHDVGSTEDCPCYVVSKYIEGTDRSAKLKGSRMKYRDAAELLATVAEALHYAHKQGLVHRDVKPGNILIGKDGRPYVVDFGLALTVENVVDPPDRFPALLHGDMRLRKKTDFFAITRDCMRRKMVTSRKSVCTLRAVIVPLATN